MEAIKPNKDAFRKYCQRRFTVKKEFLKLFYEVLKLSAFDGKGITHRKVFRLLNDLSLKETGKHRFRDYESFLITKIRLDNIALKSKFIGFKPIKYWTSRNVIVFSDKGSIN